MNVARFLRQEATLESLTARDSYSGNTYDDPVTINVRWFTETDRVDNGERVIRTSSSHISTTTEVKVGDRITDENGTVRYVEAVRKNRSAKGTFSHYVASLQ